MPVGNTGVTGEQEHVTGMVKSLSVKRCGHNPMQFLGGEIFLHGLWVRRFVSRERIGGNDAVRDGFTDNGLQLDGKVDDGSGSEVAFCPQVQVVFVYEGTVSAVNDMSDNLYCHLRKLSIWL